MYQFNSVIQEFMTMTDLKTMTDAQLTHEAKSLQALAYNAARARNARQFGRLNRQLEAVWAEQDRRRKAGG